MSSDPVTIAPVWQLLAVVVMLCGPAAAQSQDPVDFARDIHPVLADRCFPCHGPDAAHREADLRLDRELDAKEDRGGYHVIRAGDAASSELLRRILSDDDFERMPPEHTGKTLSTDEVELLRRWIDEGATWSQPWAYRPPVQPNAPPVDDPAWAGHWIDQFVWERIQAAGLSPSPEADPVTLIRRLSFDLTGLPPSPDEVEAFTQDPSPAAYAELVERLLQSSHHGERMAMHWLDLVRFADTVGYHGDQDHSISPYRDYVIDAFCDNLPFDRFTAEQLAGDLLDASDTDQKIASAYNRLLQTSHEGGVQPKEYLAMYGADRVRNVSAVWMAATLGCAECHDHKYDPYTARDFYAMQAFFADVDEAEHFKKGTNAIPTARPPEISVLTRRERERLAQLEAELAELERRTVDDAGTTVDGSPPVPRIEELRLAVTALKESARKVMITKAVEPRPIRVLPRGNWLDDSGPVVEPAVPSFLGELSTEGRATRLDLARWLTSAGGVGGLTARVFVNRLWSLFMGEGLSRILDDFGGQGQPPTHPELLDQLAIEFMESGWDVRHMIRLIVTSRTYRQSSRVPAVLRERDPGNTLFARQARFRLPAEMIRDQALAVGGLLVSKIGGASVKPYQPEGFYQHLNFPPRKYRADEDERQWRRGLYVHWQRQFLHPSLAAMDAPRREECTARRPRSNTPTAALALLNDPTYVEAARGFATRILRESGNTEEERLRFAFRLATSREPDATEVGLLAEFLDESVTSFKDHPDDAKALLSVGLAPMADDLDLIELAAWTSVARALLNLNETLTRN